MATPAVADIGSSSNVASCGRIARRKSVTIGAGDTGTNSDSFLSIIAGQSVALVGSNSSLPGSDATLTWGSKDSTGTVTTIGVTKVSSGTAFQNSINNLIVNNIVSKPGETLVVKSDVAITLYLTLVQGDRLGVGQP